MYYGCSKNVYKEHFTVFFKIILHQRECQTSILNNRKLFSFTMDLDFNFRVYEVKQQQLNKVQLWHCRVRVQIARVLQLGRAASCRLDRQGFAICRNVGPHVILPFILKRDLIEQSIVNVIPPDNYQSPLECSTSRLFILPKHRHLKLVNDFRLFIYILAPFL